MADRRHPGRRHGTSDGTPHVIDGDLTPAPADVRGIESLTPSEQLLALTEAAAQNARAIAHEQDQRNEARRHGEAISMLTASMERIVPALERAHATAVIVDELRKDVRDIVGNLATLVESHARDEARREEFDRSFERLLQKIGSVDEAGRRTESTVAGLTERVDNLDDMHNVARTRATAVEDKLAALDKRHAVTRAKLGRGDKAIVGVGGVGAGVVGHYLSDLFAWIGTHFH